MRASVSEQACPEWPPDRRRPLRLLSPPEPVEAVALDADGAPLAFRRRGRLHRLRAAEGPERLECEWWREEAPSRDYYLAEDEGGRRYWLYREAAGEKATESVEATPDGVDQATLQGAARTLAPGRRPSRSGPSRWFLHGLFA